MTTTRPRPARPRHGHHDGPIALRDVIQRPGLVAVQHAAELVGNLPHWVTRTEWDAPEWVSEITWTDMFCGAGGSSLGLHQAGHTVRFCANHDPEAIRTHEHNNPGAEHKLANLRETNFRRWPRTRALWASPSCEHHTDAQGKKQLTLEKELALDDPGAVDRVTAFAILEAAAIHRYDVIVAENVPAFQRWILYPTWLDGFHRLGYRTQEVILNAADLGPDPVPQDRPRYFMVATWKGNVDLTFEPVVRTPVSAILDPDPGKPITRRMYITPQVERITDLDVPHLVTYRNHARPRRADREVLPVVAGGGNHHAIATVTKAGAYQRLLSKRELARAQGFPDWYEFFGRNIVTDEGKKVDQVRKQIGNAVAVNVAREIGRRAATALWAA